jgi:hypothetical protein
MNRKTELLLIDFNQALAQLQKPDMMMLVNTLATRIVEDHITKHPLPDGADHDEMLAIMMCMTITEAATVAREAMQEAAKAAPQQPNPDAEAVAKAQADAAIAKAQGRLQ